jgi:hypothetical protein
MFELIEKGASGAFLFFSFVSIVAPSPFPQATPGLETAGRFAVTRFIISDIVNAVLVSACKAF